MTLQYGFGIGIIWLSMKPSLLFKNGIKIADDFFNGALGLESRVLLPGENLHNRMVSDGAQMGDNLRSSRLRATSTSKRVRRIMRHGIKLSEGFVKPEQPCILYHFQGSIYTVEWQPKEHKWTAIHVETP